MCTWLTSPQRIPLPKSLNAMESINVFITGCNKTWGKVAGELSLEILQSLKDGFLYNSNRWQDTDSFASSHKTSPSSQHSRDAVIPSYREVTETSQQHASSPTHHSRLALMQFSPTTQRCYIMQPESLISPNFSPAAENQAS